MGLRVNGRLCALLAIAGVVVPGAGARAALIHVTTTQDKLSAGGGCSLRQAVIAANSDTAGPGGDCTAGSGADTISVPSGDYKLTSGPTGGDNARSGDLNLTAPVTIAGAGDSTTTVDGQATDRVFHVQSSGVQVSGLTLDNGDPNTGNGGDVLIDAAGSLSLERSTVTNGYAGNTGGGIFNEGTLTVKSSTINMNFSSSFGSGIANTGTVTIDSSSITGNHGATNGAGIYDGGPSFTATNTTVSGNATDAEGGAYGGGLELDGTATLAGVQVISNTSSGRGAGIYAGGALTIKRSMVSGNSFSTTGTDQVLGGGIYAANSLTLINSWIHDNSALNSLASPQGLGGGIDFAPLGASEQVDVEGSTIGPNNTAAGGDGIELTSGSASSTMANVKRSTIAGNGADTVSGLGGGVAVGSHVTANLDDVTLAENEASASTGGGNLYAENGATVSFQNTLIARPFGGGNCDHGTTATLTSGGGDQEYGDSQHQCGFAHAGDVASTDDLLTSQLGELADNGGVTETMALLAGAPPLNTGAGCQGTDQRGVPRPQGSACDSGAYELDTKPPTVTIISGPAGTVTTRTVHLRFRANEPARFRCKLDNGSFASCRSPFAVHSLALGHHTFSVRATDIAGNVGAVSSRAFTVAAPPRLFDLRQSAKRWREGDGLAHFTTKGSPPVGTTFTFGLSEKARVRFAFRRNVRGRIVHGKCVAPTTANAGKRRCRRSVRGGLLDHTGHAGSNALHFQGRLSRTRKLPSGSYTLVVSARASGLNSKPVTLHFTIVGG